MNETRPILNAGGLRGFSLTELMVVLAIIAVLIGLAIPAVSQIRAASRRMQCAGNQGQIASAVLAYARRHDGRMVPLTTNSVIDMQGVSQPAAFNLDSKLGASHTWADVLYRQGYLRADAFACPNDDEQVVSPGTGERCSYGLNFHLYASNMKGWGGQIAELTTPAKLADVRYYCHVGSGGDGSYGPKTSEIVDPANTILLMDIENVKNTAAPDQGYRTGYVSNMYYKGTAGIHRHPGLQLAAMCDGSVRSEPFEEFWGFDYRSDWWLEEHMRNHYDFWGNTWGAHLEPFEDYGDGLSGSYGQVVPYVLYGRYWQGFVEQPWDSP